MHTFFNLPISSIKAISHSQVTGLGSIIVFTNIRNMWYGINQKDIKMVVRIIAQEWKCNL